MVFRTTIQPGPIKNKVNQRKGKNSYYCPNVLSALTLRCKDNITLLAWTKSRDMRNYIKIGGVAKTIEDMDFLVNMLQAEG